MRSAGSSGSGRPAATRQHANPSTTLLRQSVSLSAIAGFGLGLTLLTSIALKSAGALPFDALAQAHGQVQTLGFIGLFIFGTAAQLLPGFLATPLQRRRTILAGGWLVTIGLIARVGGQPLQSGLFRDILLGLSLVGVTVGFGLCLYGFADLLTRSLQPTGLWRTLLFGGLGFLVVGLTINLAAVGTLIAGSATVPTPIDAALVEAELWGFPIFLVFGVSRKMLPHLLQLAPSNDRRIRLGAVCYGTGVLLTIAADLLGATDLRGIVPDVLFVAAWLEIFGVALFLRGLGIYRKAARPSTLPLITEPARRWIRIAFGWLVVAPILVALYTLPALLTGASGIADDVFEVGAARHALGEGFLLTLIVALGARILPGYSAWAIRHPRVSEILVMTLTAGAVFRVIGEVGIAQDVEGSAVCATIGGTLSVSAFLVFAVILGVTTGRTSRPAPRKQLA